MALFFKLYAIVFVALILLDTLWIGFVASGFYRTHLGYIFAEKFSLLPAVLFYIVYAGGLTFLIVEPSLGKPLWQVFLLGALVGAMAYGAYDFTNQATLRNWPVIITVVDLCWGIFATGFAVMLGVLIGRI